MQTSIVPTRTAVTQFYQHKAWRNKALNAINIILLDNHSICDSFSNRKLLKEIKVANDSIMLVTNRGDLKTSTHRYLKGY